jgi:hypothetical protein
MKAKRGLSGLKPLRSVGSSESQAGSSGQRQTTMGTTGVESTQIIWFLGSQMDEARLCEQWPEDTQKSPKLKGDYQARVCSGQMVPMVVRQQGWTT